MDRIWSYQSKKYVYNTSKMFAVLSILSLVSVGVMSMMQGIYFAAILIWIPYRFFYNDFEACINSGISRKDFLKSTMRSILLLSLLVALIFTAFFLLSYVLFKAVGYETMFGVNKNILDSLSVFYSMLNSTLETLLVFSIYAMLCYKYGRKAFITIAIIMLFPVFNNAVQLVDLSTINQIVDFILYDRNILIQTVKSAVYFTILYQILKSQVLKLELN